MKIIKKLFWIILVIVFLIIIAVYIATETVNPNKYKPQIQQWVKDHTGYTIKIKGNIVWDIYPSPMINAHNVELFNPGQQQGMNKIADVGDLAVRIKLLPLLTGKMQFAVGNVEFKNANFEFVKLASGARNWDHNTSKPSPQVNPSNINLHKANLNWKNQQTHNALSLKNLNLSVQPIQGNFYPLIFSFDFASNRPWSKGHIQGRAMGQLDFKNHRYILNKVSYNGTLIGINKKFPQPLPISFQGNLDINLPLQEITATKITARIDNADFLGGLVISNILQAPIAKGHLDIPPFNLRALLEKLKVKNLPENPKAFELVKGEMDINASEKYIKLNNIMGQFDNSAFQGDFSYASFNNDNIDFNFSLNRLDLSSYLTANNKINSDAPKAMIPLAAVAIAAQQSTGFNCLRSLSGDGKLTINRLFYQSAQLNDVNIELKASLGNLIISPFSAKLYDGSTDNKITVNVRNSTPSYQWISTFNHINLGTMLHDMKSTNKLSGFLNLGLQLNATGNSNPEILSSLQGQGKLNIQNGAIADIDLNSLIKPAGKLQTLTLGDTKNITPLSDLHGSFVINKGLLQNHDLFVSAKHFMATGNGVINLVNQTINYTLTTELLNQRQFNHLHIPITFTGNILKPNINVNYASIGQQLLMQKLKTAVPK